MITSRGNRHIRPTGLVERGRAASGLDREVLWNPEWWPRRPKAVDLFCGAGGLSEGLRQTGFSVLAGADYDPDACATFSLNFLVFFQAEDGIRDAELRERVVAAAAGADV